MSLSFASTAIQSAACVPLLMCCFHLPSLSQTLPKIDLNNYSVVPPDEGDEDRDFDSDDDAAGSDLDLDLGDGDSEEGLAHVKEGIPVTCERSDLVCLSCAELWHQSSSVMAKLFRFSSPSYWYQFVPVAFLVLCRCCWD